MKPHADREAGLQVRDLKIESGTGRITVSGSLDFARDRQARDHAEASRSVFDDVVFVLQVDAALPAKEPESKVAGTTMAKNPCS